MKISRLTLLLLLGIASACAAPPRAVYEDDSSEFALYRSGRLAPTDLAVLCRLGVEEILVLDGEGARRECVMKETTCPGLRVRYDFAQEEDRPVSVDFLQAFDAWIEQARREGRKVAFRCRHGWHRTGRLAAYYRLRHESASAEEVIEEMHEIGSMMWRHPTLDGQVRAYAELVAGSACTQGPEACPLEQADGGLSEGRFPLDACTTDSAS